MKFNVKLIYSVDNIMYKWKQKPREQSNINAQKERLLEIANNDLKHIEVPNFGYQERQGT